MSKQFFFSHERNSPVLTWITYTYQVCTAHFYHVQKLAMFSIILPYIILEKIQSKWYPNSFQFNIFSNNFRFSKSVFSFIKIILNNLKNYYVNIYSYWNTFGTAYLPFFYIKVAYIHIPLCITISMLEMFFVPKNWSNKHSIFLRYVVLHTRFYVVGVHVKNVYNRHVINKQSL